MELASVPGHEQASRRSIVFTFPWLLLIVFLQFSIARADRLLFRYFWLDEIYTYTLVSDPSFLHAMEALNNGVETHPPTLFVLLRWYTWLAGVSEFSLRLFALLSIVTGLAAIYLLLCRVFQPVVALTGTLALWCHPLLLEHAFEARFYGPWLAACAWYACLLQTLSEHSRLPIKIALVLMGVVVCTIHYFGVLTFVLITCADLYFRTMSFAVRRWISFTAILGILSALATVPLALSQRRAFAVASWISPVDAGSGWDFLTTLFFERYLIIFLFAPWLTRLQAFRPAVPVHHRAEHSPARLAGLTSLLLLPFILLIVSLVWQPVHVDRYALPTLLGLAPVTAYLAAQSSRYLLALTIGFLFVVGTVNLRSSVNVGEGRNEQSDQLIAVLREKTNDSLIVFRRPHRLYVVSRYAPDLAPRCVQMDFELEQVPDIDNFHIFVRDLSRRFSENYESPAMIPFGTLQARNQFYFVGLEPYEDTQFLQRLFSGFSVRKIDRFLYDLRKE